MTNDRAYSAIAVSVLESVVGNEIPRNGLGRNNALEALNCTCTITELPKVRWGTPAPQSVAVTVAPLQVLPVMGPDEPKESVMLMVSLVPQLEGVVTDGDPVEVM